MTACSAVRPALVSVDHGLSECLLKKVAEVIGGIVRHAFRSLLNDPARNKRRSQGNHKHLRRMRGAVGLLADLQLDAGVVAAN